MSLYVNLGGVPRRIVSLYAGTPSGVRRIKKLITADGAVFSAGGTRRTLTPLASYITQGNRAGSGFTSYSRVSYAAGVLTGTEPYTDTGAADLSSHIGRFCLFTVSGDVRVCFIRSVSGGGVDYTAIDTAGLATAARGADEYCAATLSAGTCEFTGQNGVLGPVYAIYEYC